MLEFRPEVWIVLYVSAFIVGLTKTGIPGIGILAVVLLASVMDAKDSVGFVLPVLIAGDILAVAYYRRHAVWRHLLRLMPPALVGIGLGYLVMRRVEGAQLGPIIGAIVITLLAADYWRQRSAAGAKVPTQWWFAVAIGAAAGVMTVLSNAAGPLVVIYFVAMRFEKEKFIGTAAWYFLVLNCVKVPLFLEQGIITWNSFRAGMMLVPGVLAGAAAGVLVLKRIPQKWFVVVVKLLALAAAIKLLLS